MNKKNNADPRLINLILAETGGRALANLLTFSCFPVFFATTLLL
jgi:hypothetical protein